MGDDSKIEWTDATWNPVVGCSKVSPGCAHCYAESLALRYRWTPKPWTPENAAENVILKPARLDQPLRWVKPRMIFVNSMSDLFHELVPDEYIQRVFDVMAECQRHTFQVLTKRPERMRDFRLAWHAAHPECGPLPNVWLGTSIENRRFVSRADVLRETPAAVRFISAEPLLGPLVPFNWVQVSLTSRGRTTSGERSYVWEDEYQGPGLDLTGIDWLIVGGESGPGHRPMNPDWARDLREAALRTQDICEDCDHGVAGGRPCTAPGCRDGRIGGTAFFFKQHGGRTPKAGGRELDGRTWDEMPEATR